MIERKIMLSIFLLTLVVIKGHAQNVFSDLKSLEKRADYYYSRLSYTKAIELYGQALLKKRNKRNYTLNMKAAALYKKMAKYSEAKSCYENIIASGHSFTAIDSVCYFNILKACGTIESDTNLSNVFSGIILGDFFRDSLYYSIEELPFNSSLSEYCPVPLKQGILYVTDRETNALVHKYNSINEGSFASMYFRGRKDSTWSSAAEITIPLENALHIGPVTFYNQQKEAILNVCLKDNKKPYRLLLYKAKYDSISGLWSEITPLPFNHKSYSVGHPAITEDGKTIFFVSDKKGGYGGTDLYTSHLLNREWTEPENMGPRINSSGDEKYPYLNKENVLFFSSDGRYGLGGMDIYYSDLSFKDTMVLNMGAPVNSCLDDFSFCYDEKNKISYFSSNRKSNGSQDDLFQMKENKISLNVILIDDFDKKPLVDVEIEIWDVDLNIQIKCFYEEKSNEINAWLKPAHRYKVFIQKEDYRNDTLLVSTYSVNDYSKPLTKLLNIKRKYIYHGNLKLRSIELKENIDTSVIIINNITTKQRDTIICVGPSLIIKLDAECEYIITSRNKDTLRYIYVEEKNIKNITVKSFYNMYLSSARPMVFRVMLKNCSNERQEENMFANSTIKVVDWVNRNEFNITPGPDGDFQFVVTDIRLFDLYINDSRILYSKQEIKSSGYCIEFID